MTCVGCNNKYRTFPSLFPKPKIVSGLRVSRLQNVWRCCSVLEVYNVADPVAWLCFRERRLLLLLLGEQQQTRQKP